LLRVNVIEKVDSLNNCLSIVAYRQETRRAQ